ncbi:MAG: cation:proton antiporter, partial [Verrucomicrobia bacterium]|nr:cation:proton antiporter [Verrucomicrobiota bacterium]
MPGLLLSLQPLPLLAAAAGGTGEVWPLLFQLVLLLSVALLLGMLLESLGQSAILGYLLAGTLMGPAVLNVVHANTGVPILAELGVSLLLFAFGLEFSIQRLLRLGNIAIVGGTLQVGLTLGTACGISLLAGFELRVALAIGAMVALSSTACVLRVLTDRAELDSVHGRSALGILLLQDIAVVPLVLLVTMLGGAGTLTEMGLGFLKAVGLIAALVGGFYVLSNFILPRMLKRLSLARDRELLILLAVILALGSASAAHSLQISPALGAFIAGIMLAESPFATQIRSDIGALRALFITMFFASVGMLGDPGWILSNFGRVALVVALIIISKATIITFITFITALLKRPLRYAVATGVSLAQVGEFGVVIAGIARADALLDDDTFHLLVSATLIAFFLTPSLVRHAPSIGDWIGGRLPGIGPCSRPGTGPSGSAPAQSNHVIVVGFGPSGRRVAEELHLQNRKFQILDLRPPNIELAKSLGYPADLCDATNL